MPLSNAVIRLPSGHSVTVVPGDLVGRIRSAACRIADPRVSEAHALVSLRGAELRLVALRGALRVDDHAEDEVALQAGQAIELAPGVQIVVSTVQLPDRVLALSVDEAAPLELLAAVYSLVRSPEPEFVARFVATSPLRVWSTADGWQAQVEDRAPVTIRGGERWSVTGLTVSVTELAVGAIGAEATVRGGQNLRLVVRHPIVHIHRDRRESVAIDGLPARILTELAAMGVPAEWTHVAGELWPQVQDRLQLRTLWDRTRQRLKNRLREAGVREDLVRSDGTGNVELFLRPGDTVEDLG